MATPSEISKWLRRQAEVGGGGEEEMEKGGETIVRTRINGQV